MMATYHFANGNPVRGLISGAASILTGGMSEGFEMAELGAELAWTGAEYALEGTADHMFGEAGGEMIDSVFEAKGYHDDARDIYDGYNSRANPVYDSDSEDDYHTGYGGYQNEASFGGYESEDSYGFESDSSDGW